MRQHFFLGTSYLGEATRRAFIARGLDQLLDPPSLHFFCKVCGEVYAKAPVVRSDGSTVPWRVISHCCARCQPAHFTSNPPGSLLAAEGCDPDLLSALPDAALKQEFLRHLEWFETPPLERFL